MIDDKKKRLATMYGTGRKPVEAFRFHPFPASSGEAKRLINAYRENFPDFSLAYRISAAVTPATWLIVLRRDAWLTLMLQVDDGRDPLCEYLGRPLLVLDIEEEFLLCGT
jgi:hypothetical protein